MSIFKLHGITSPEIAIRKMERCVISTRQWMKTNMLKLNDDKTEILIIRPKSAHQHHLPESVRIGSTNVTPNTHARNLGVTFDAITGCYVVVPPKLLLEIVEQISIPLATMFNLSLEEGLVPLKWKETNIIPLFFFKVRETSQRTIDQ